MSDPTTPQEQPVPNKPGWYECRRHDGKRFVFWFDGARLWLSPDGSSPVSNSRNDYTDFIGPLVPVTSQPVPAASRETAERIVREVFYHPGGTTAFTIATDKVAAILAAEYAQRPSTNRNKITLCGSTRFKRAWLEWNARLTLEGNVVLTVAMWSHNVRIEPTPDQKLLLDEIHKAKIDDSDEIFVLDVGGYVGSSTRSEIEHAERTGKRVRYLSQEFPEWTEADCVYAAEYAAPAGECKHERLTSQAVCEKCGKEFSIEELDKASAAGEEVERLKERNAIALMQIDNWIWNLEHGGQSRMNDLESELRCLKHVRAALTPKGTG